MIADRDVRVSKSKIPITERQACARRENGRKSKGPKTPRGKVVSRKNALKHGLFSKCIPRREHPCIVDKEEYDDFIECLMEDYNPTNQLGVTLVESLAFEMMRLRHLHDTDLRMWEQYFDVYGTCLKAQL